MFSLSLRFDSSDGNALQTLRKLWNGIDCFKVVIVEQRKKQSFVKPFTACEQQSAQLFLRCVGNDPMRDFISDWRRWSCAERIAAVLVALLMLTIPLGAVVQIPAL